MKDWIVNTVDGISYLTEPLGEFEKSYIEVRLKENRVHDDEFVKSLPEVPKVHPHYSEWQKRLSTLRKFTKYLGIKKPKSVLEIGCGNGWFSQKLAPFSENVFGLDVGKTELAQAARCAEQQNVQYVCCSDWCLLPPDYFDIIVFAGSFQYFKTDPEFWEQLNRTLKVNGEIHILDTHFYPKKEVESAKNRSQDYFSKLGVSEASNYYQHQCWEDLPNGYKIKYAPNFLNKIFRNRSPFPWVCIYKSS